MDDVTRKKLDVKLGESYEFQFRRPFIAGQIAWAWSATEVAYRYFMATTKDHRTRFQFSVSDETVQFEAVVFSNGE